MEKQESSIIIYTTEDGSTNLQVKMENETVWLSTSQMAELFSREESNIRRHIINVFKEGELVQSNNVHFYTLMGSRSRFLSIVLMSLSLWATE